MGSKLMVVDDSIMVRQHVKRALAATDFAVVEAQDGFDALEKLAANPDVGLVICDVNMPRMGGVDFLERIRQDDRWKTLQVVFLTTETRRALVEKATALGAKGWLIKPFKAEVILAVANKLLDAKAA